MKISVSANEYAQGILSDRRAHAEDVLDERRQLLYGADERIRNLFTKISETGINAALGSLSGPAQDPTETISGLTDQIKTLMVADGFPADYLDNIYSCPKCRDTGTLPDGSSCGCYLRLVSKYNMDRVAEVSPLRLCSFETFDLSYYSEEKDPAYDMSPREIVRDNLQACKDFLLSFGSGKNNLLMMGDSGLGKTHLALSIANELIVRGYNVIYCSAPSIFKQIETEYFEEHRSAETLNRLKSCDLLVLDDLGAEYINASTNAVIYDLIDTRLNTKKSTIITTNITDEKLLSKRYGEKVSSRLIGSCRILPFIGDDIRIKLNEA